MKPLIAFFAGLVVCGGLVTMAAPLKPDILFLMPDQMRGDCLSLLGHPVVRTPNLDKLAQEGALFRRAYSTCPWWSNGGRGWSRSLPNAPKASPTAPTSFPAGPIRRCRKG
jgi:hypothetical protein